MARIILVFVLAIAASLALEGVTQSATFFVTSPNVFRVGVPERVIVALINISENVQNVPVKVSLRQPGSDVPFVESTRSVSTGRAESFNVTIESEHLVRNEGYFQHMVLKAESLNTEAYQFEDETEVLVTLQSGYVFVQTDKPIYTPNQVVKIKVMSLGQDMLPSSRTVHVEILNPSGIKLMRLKQTRAKNGFLEGEYRFHNHPAYGNWSVTASYGHEFLVKSTVTFVLKEYVLPTFSVNIETPKYILAGSDLVSTTINARYVYGEPVVGHFIFQYGILWTDGTIQELGEKRGLLNDQGSAEVTLRNLNADFGQNWFDRFRDCRFHVKAIVFETATQFSEASINTKAIFVNSPYKFITRRSVQYFKTGLNYRVKLDLTFVNGDVAPEVPVEITATGTFKNKSMQLQGTNVDGNQVNSVTKTDDKGGISMLLNIPRDVEKIRIMATTVSKKFERNQATIFWEVNKAESPTRESIVIRADHADDRSLVVGRQIDFVVHRAGSANTEGTDLHFLCITGGKIALQGVQKNMGAGTTNLPIRITSGMIPQMRLIVYYVSKIQDHVIADSLLVGVKERCMQEPTLELKILPYKDRSERIVKKPDSPIEIQVQAPNDSHVGLLAVDKAVYLLRDKDRMTNRKMYDRMKSYDTGCGPGGGLNTAQIFKDSGMTVLSNANLEVPVREDIGCMDEATRKRRSADRVQNCLGKTYLQPCFSAKPRFRDRLERASWTCTRQARLLGIECEITAVQKEDYRQCCMNPSQESADTGRSAGDSPHQTDAVTVREDFRETWFFDVISMSGHGTYQYQVSTLSSITEWHLTAISLSPTQGMCVADDTTVTVFQNFFIQLHLPYSVVRLEQTEVIATIFNYDDNLRDVMVNFTAEEGLCTPENPAIRRVVVDAKRAASVTFIVRPVKVGDFKISVSAGGSLRRDSIRKTLRVVPQGVVMRKGRSITLNPGSVMFNEPDVTTPSPNDTLRQETISNSGQQIEEIMVSLPEEFIPKTESCSVKLIGNLLGTIVTDPIKGLEGLVRRPTGCGEQTMYKFGPTLFVYQYLRAVEEDTPELEDKAYEYIAHGVAHEMTYRQNNGAYAIYTHVPGSTWLTAFVVKVFSHASRLIKVESGHVQESMNWLIDNNQLPSGAFQENQAVGNKALMGAVESETSLTAFVLVSLLESHNILVPANEKIDSAIKNATKYLEEQVKQNSIRRVYDKAIVTYALALAESRWAEQANHNLTQEGQVEADSGAISFIADAANYRDGNQPYWLTKGPSAIDVETAGYALLAQLALHDYQTAGRIALWLSKQQNYGGDFVSTQDTVVALQALAKYAELPDLNNIDLDCDITTTSPSGHHNGLIMHYRIRNDNAKIQEEVDATQSIGGTLRIVSQGTGVAKANVELRYNTEKSDIDTCPFHLNVTAVETDGGLRITVCTRYLNTEKSTHMSIIDVGLYSGYKAVDTELKQLKNSSDLISIIESGSRSVIFYLDEIPNDRDFCFTFSAEVNAVVKNVQAAAVHVYDYYDPEYCNTLPCPTNFSVRGLERTTCSSYHGYALEVTISSTDARSGYRIYNFTVLTPIKTGEDFVARDAERQLFVDEGCQCPKVKPRTLGEKFLLVGEKGIKYTTEQGEEGYKYLYGPTSKLIFWPSTRRERNRNVFDLLQKFKDSMLNDACANERF